MFGKKDRRSSASAPDTASAESDQSKVKENSVPGSAATPESPAPSEESQEDDMAPPLEDPIYTYDDGSAPMPDEPPFDEPPYEEEQSYQISSAPAVKGEEWWDTLLDTMKNDNHAVLMGSMSKGSHNLQKNHLTLTFPSRYLADSVEREKAYITKLISHIMGNKIDINLVIEEPVEKKKKVIRDEKVELFLRVFRGTVIEDKKRRKP